MSRQRENGAARSVRLAGLFGEWSQPLNQNAVRTLENHMDMSIDAASMMKKLDNLERSVRCYRRLLIAALVAGGACLTMGMQDPPKKGDAGPDLSVGTVRAERIELRSPDSSDKIVLTPRSLAIEDRQGSLAVGAGGIEMRLATGGHNWLSLSVSGIEVRRGEQYTVVASRGTYSRQGQNVVRSHVDDEGAMIFIEGKPAVMPPGHQTSPPRDPRLAWLPTAARLVLGLSGSEGAFVKLLDSSSNGRVTIGRDPTTQDKEWSITLRDKEAKVVDVMPRK